MDSGYLRVTHRSGPCRGDRDATDLIVMPRGIGGHVHTSQPSGSGIEMPDDFASVTRAAAYGGSFKTKPYRLPNDGRSLCQAVTARLATAGRGPMQRDGRLALFDADKPSC